MRFNIPTPEALQEGLEGPLTCFKVMLPNNTEYRALLGGLLWLLTRGRTYDERSGVIREAQRVGYRIFEASYPLRECDSACVEKECDCDPCQTGRGGAILEGEETDMGQVVTDVQIVDGKLRVFFGPCCWHDLGSAADLIDATDRTGDLPNDVQPDNNDKDVRCQKAYGIASHVFNMAALLCQAPDSFVLGLYHDLMAAYPSVSFDRTDLALAWAEWAAYTGAGLDFDDGSPAFKRYVCNLRAAFENTWGISSDEFKAMKSSLGSAVDLVTDAIMHGLIDAVGPGDWNDIALALALVPDEFDCTCPGVGLPSLDPGSEGWYLGEWSDELSLVNTTNSGVFDTAYVAGHTLAEDTYGWALVVTSRSSGRVKGCTPAEAGVTDGSSPVVKGGTDYLYVKGTIQLTCNALTYQDFASANPEAALYWAGEEDAGSVDFSHDIASPKWAAGAIVNWSFRNNWNEATNITFRVAPLHNVNSLSHQ